MYQFNIMQDSEDVWRFELSGINLLINGFFIKDEKHWIKNPKKAIGFLNINNNLYGLANNEPVTYDTAEDFYDVMLQQYMILKNGQAIDNNESLKKKIA
jgi:hypothetical protein